jgi:hypothetical protein
MPARMPAVKKRRAKSPPGFVFDEFLRVSASFNVLSFIIRDNSGLHESFRYTIDAAVKVATGR